MVEVNIPVPTFIADRLKELAKLIGVSVNALANYFFATEVVHTSQAAVSAVS